jgi:hypothetical protein
MKRAAALALAVIVALACAKPKQEKPLSVPGEKVYVLDGRIVGRDASDNTLKLDHKEIPGYMEAMTMDYPVRGARVDALPANGTHVNARLHATDDAGIWLTDVKQVR